VVGGRMDLGPDGSLALLEPADREVLQHCSDRLRGTRLDSERGEAFVPQADCGEVQAALEEAHDGIVPCCCARLRGEVRVERRYHASIRRGTSGVRRSI